MKCKFCGAELEDGVNVCPVCNKELTDTAAEEVAEEVEAVQEKEVAPKKSLSKGWKIALAISSVVLLAVILTGAILHFMGLGGKVLHNLKFWRENDIFYKLTYTVDDAKAEKDMDKVIATVGDMTLTNGELQAHYWISVYDFIEYYGYYLSMMGVDVSKPLDEQVYDEKTGITFQQMLLGTALESWYRYATLIQMSEEADFTTGEDEKKYMDSLRSEIEKMATDKKYTDVEKFIDDEFFPGCSLDAYLKYNQTAYVALSYYNKLYEDMTPTQDEMEAYYTANEAELKKNGFAKEDGNYYDVRHILVEIKGGTKDDKGVMTYTDAEWEACRAEAQKLLDEFLAGETTEAKFAELAKTHSKDPGSASNGGLYSKLTKDYGFIEDFENWYVAETRKTGDTGLVKNTQSSVQGYHIMYFAGSTPIWETEVKDTMLAEGTAKLMEEAQAKWPMEVDYKNIVLGLVELG